MNLLIKIIIFTCLVPPMAWAAKPKNLASQAEPLSLSSTSVALNQLESLFIRDEKSRPTALNLVNKKYVERVVVPLLEKQPNVSHLLGKVLEQRRAVFIEEFRKLSELGDNIDVSAGKHKKWWKSIGRSFSSRVGS